MNNEQCRANKGKLEQPNLDLPRKKMCFFHDNYKKDVFPTKTSPKHLGEFLNRLPQYPKLEDCFFCCRLDKHFFGTHFGSDHFDPRAWSGEAGQKGGILPRPFSVKDAKSEIVTGFDLAR